MSRNKFMSNLSRRRLLAGGSAAAAAAAAAASLRGRRALSDPIAAGSIKHLALDPEDRKLLFVVCATGGGSIIDSFLPVAESEADPGVAPGINVYPDSLIVQPPGSNIRCVNKLSDPIYTSSYDLPTFLAKHYQDLVVMTHEGTSVNHSVAQKRAVTGANINRGRTISEAMAEIHGAGLPLPNVNMAVGGYVEPGDDPSLPTFARPEIVADPLMFAASTHGSRGILEAPTSQRMAQARAARAKLEAVSPFGQTYPNAPLRSTYMNVRSDLSPSLEELDLITKLMMIPPDQLPPQYGLEASPLADQLPGAFSKLYEDRWEQQAALAFLLSHYGLSAATTISLTFDPIFVGDEVIGTPLAFDYSHNDHRTAQNVMWSRVMLGVDGLISMLKAFDYMGDPELGKMWDRSLIYIATDFGREKIRPSNSTNFSTGHHLNNGSVLISPMLKGNQIYGGIDPDTCLTYGFDGLTGEPDEGDLKREGDVYSLVAQAMGIEFAGRRDLSGLIR